MGKKHSAPPKGQASDWLSPSSRETLQLARRSATTARHLEQIDDTEERLRRNSFIVRQLSESEYRIHLAAWNASQGKNSTGRPTRRTSTSA